ncbi:MAG: AraC family transcriptional regulator [Clostridia bacterium]|nr:AraC family transcriptional regulator [Clostridia bacterium]
MQSIRLYDMPRCRMIASPAGMFGEPALDRFCEWLSHQPRTLFPRDFLTFDDSDPAHPGFRWLYVYDEDMELPDAAEVIDFPGGMYAVATGIDQQTDKVAMDKAVAEFLTQHGMALDGGRKELGHIITSPRVHDRLGYDQMDYWYPIK